jgi:DNA-binding IscR family transcriptional regulator
MAGLRKAGYVRSAKGHGGGWEIACDLDRVSLKDVYEALGEPTLFAIGAHVENPTCLIERAVNNSLADAFAEAEKLLIGRLGDVTLATLARQVGHGLRDHARRLNHAV